MTWRNSAGLVFVALGALLLVSAGCSEDDGDGSKGNTLTVGNTDEQSIGANKTKTFKFRSTDFGAYSIYMDSVEPGEASTLIITADEEVECPSAEALDGADAKTCSYTDNLEADTTYEFDMEETSGEDRTFRLGPTYGGQ